MKTLASREIQSHFGNVANIVKSGEPVVITQYGRPTMMILPYETGKEALEIISAHRMTNLLDSLRPVDPQAPDLSLEDVNHLVHELRP